jgi:hypothetical protein
MKTRTVLLVLIVFMLLLTSSSGLSKVRASSTASSASSGGQYRLTIQTTSGSPLTGYLFLPAGTTVLPGQGCCCKNYLTCVRK